MSDNQYKHLKVGDFVRCHFPHMRLNDFAPSEHDHCALIVDITHDAELGIPVFTMVHSTKELERQAKASGTINETDFRKFLHAVIGRIQVSDNADRIVNHEQVVLLPVVEDFFHDLKTGHIEVLDTIDMATVDKIRRRMKQPPNAAALAHYRTEMQYQAVEPDFLVKLREANEDPSP
jgi:hypothetical protein